MAQAIVAYLHYLSIFLLFALLVLQHRLLCPPLDLERARSLAVIDRGYGLCVLAVLANGLARALWYGKGVDYYLHNGLFHAKVGPFALAALVSLLPTVTFLGWHGVLKAGEVSAVTPTRGRWVVMAMRLRLLLLLTIPLLATLMAHGLGMCGRVLSSARPGHARPSPPGAAPRSGPDADGRSARGPPSRR